MNSIPTLQANTYTIDMYILFGIKYKIFQVLISNYLIIYTIPYVIIKLIF